MANGCFLVTGAAGFIGNHIADRLSASGNAVVGIDNFDPYYDPALKRARIERLRARATFRFERLDITDRALVKGLFAGQAFDAVIHLAGQAGVRYSIERPQAFIDANLTGFLNILEESARAGIGHLLYASSSSVYGASPHLPFREDQPVDHALSVYAASKRANELLAHVYAHQYGLAATGLRFFTVYGPWGRPDMALYKFALAIARGDEIPLHEHGRMRRDFTYIDDVVEAVIRLIDHRPRARSDLAAPGPDVSAIAPHQIFNIGNDHPEWLSDYLAELEKCLGKTARIRPVPMAPGEVPTTWADISKLHQATGFRPATPISLGIARFSDWFKAYHRG